jgi:hypothetical protein
MTIAREIGPTALWPRFGQRRTVEEGDSAVGSECARCSAEFVLGNEVIQVLLGPTDEANTTRSRDFTTHDAVWTLVHQDCTRP